MNIESADLVDSKLSGLFGELDGGEGIGARKHEIGRFFSHMEDEDAIKMVGFGRLRFFLGGALDLLTLEP